jgi:hypothetical protein
MTFFLEGNMIKGEMRKINRKRRKKEGNRGNTKGKLKVSRYRVPKYMRGAGRIFEVVILE